MCGIAGFWTSRPMGMQRAREVANAMGLRIKHRGPDAWREWVDDDGAVALAHRRLSIVDLSSAGSQPMRSASGRFELVYNGEIYNHAELRTQLPSQEWRGHSDTETLLAAIEHWGFEGALRKSIGMFAIAMWDRKLRQLTLARDRMGEKPLHYGVVRGSVIFASELKALRAYPDFEPEVNRGAASLMLRHCYVPAPHTIFTGVFKLPPGTFAVFSSSTDLPEPVSYWSLRDVAESGLATRFGGSEVEAIDAVEQQIESAIAIQREADVPLGAFLSGGVDSSLIVALMQKQSRDRVRTFTIGFDEPRFNEAEHAKRVAQHLGTDHTEMYVSGKDALDLVPILPTLYCEPFSDASQLPTILVSRIARRHVTVALSGDAGDELYGGYTRYGVVGEAWRNARARRSWFGRSQLAFFSTLRASTKPVSHTHSSIARLDEFARKQISLLRCKDSGDYYRIQVARNNYPDDLIGGAIEPLSPIANVSDHPNFSQFDEQMMYLDQVSYLPDDILCKVDRAAMSAGLETRVPLLDHRVVAQAWSLPLEMKRRDGVGKWILRQILDRYVPRNLIDRPKVGFSVPLNEWLAGPLRPWAEDLLEPRRLREGGLLKTEVVRRLWDDQVSGRRQRPFQVWDILMLQAWLQNQHIPS